MNTNPPTAIILIPVIMLAGTVPFGVKSPNSLQNGYNSFPFLDAADFHPIEVMDAINAVEVLCERTKVERCECLFDLCLFCEKLGMEFKVGHWWKYLTGYWRPQEKPYLRRANQKHVGKRDQRTPSLQPGECNNWPTFLKPLGCDRVQKQSCAAGKNNESRKQTRVP